MRILIVSDTHLNLHFSQQKFDFLKRIISESDKVILNGDFWDGFHQSFDDFLISPWKDLFPLLKSKNTVYLYGNHDKSELCDDRVDLFSVWHGSHYEEKIGGKIYVFEHGNRLAVKLDEKFHIKKVNYRLYNMADKLHGAYIHTIGIKGFQYMYGRWNRKIKKQLKGELKPNEVFVCGHTHCQDLDLTNQFVNTGIFNFGFAQYGILDENGITLHDERYA